MTAPTIATTARHRTSEPQVIDTVLLKTASRCNLDCTYCYVYNMGDDAWRKQPKRMSVEVVEAIVDQVSRLSHSQSHPLSVVLHGGEPLLLGLESMERLLHGLRSRSQPGTGLHVQTNGLLLEDDFIELFVRYDVGVSISFDGPIHDLNRVDHADRGSHDRVLAAIDRVLRYPGGNHLLGGVLAVVDPRSDPVAVYEALKGTGTPSFDLLYRDGSHADLPFGKSDPTSTEYGDWMVALTDAYLRDPSPPRIRVIDDLLRLILGGRGQKEGVGLTEYGILVIDTDGTITKNDTLKVAHVGADRFEVPRNVTEIDLLNFVATEEFADYFALQEPSAPACRSCPELGVCGGGMPAHRFSPENGFNNPTIFCADQLVLIGELRRRVGVQAPARIEPI